MSVGRMVALYSILLWSCSIAFLASIPILLAIRARRPQRMPWWLVIVLSAAVGWLASNCYMLLENWQNEAERDDLFEQGTLADFSYVTNPSQTIPWGWIVGLIYLAVCSGLSGLFRTSTNPRVSRPVIGLLTAGIALATFACIPPWNFGFYVPFTFVLFYAWFILCAGLSYQALRKFHLEKPWYPFVVMFCVTILIFAGLLSLSRDTHAFIAKAANWAALYGAMFTALWWIAIRPDRGETGAPPQ
jgi:hypothetical protein